jgi:YHS domain-containing protein
MGQCVVLFDELEKRDLFTHSIDDGGEVKKVTVDPVCKTLVNPKKAKDQAEHQGQTYYFCTPECKQTFEENPEKYAYAAPRGGCQGCCGC